MLIVNLSTGKTRFKSRSAAFLVFELNICGCFCRNVKRVQLRNVHDIERDSIEQLVSAFGTVLRFDTGLCKLERCWCLVWCI